MRNFLSPPPHYGRHMCVPPKSEIDGLRSDHDALQQAHDAFQNSMERENDLRKNEIRSLEERQQKDNQVRKRIKSYTER